MESGYGKYRSNGYLKYRIRHQKSAGGESIDYLYSLMREKHSGSKI